MTDTSSNKKGFLLDMDGVIYKGSEIIPGAKEFVNTLLRDSIPFIFVTNNSQRTRRDIVTKLRRLEFDIQEQHVFTSALATAEYLATHNPGGTCFVIGEGGLLNALHEFNYSVVDHDPDFVVVGEGRTMTMEVMESATNMLLKGAKLIATNLDPNCPTSRGRTRPGCGAIVRMLETATGLTAFSVGKPNPLMLRSARKRLDLRTNETIMVGDNMETDIIGGVQLNYKTVLVLTGVTQKEDLKNYAFQPDIVLDSIAELLNDTWDNS